MQERIEVFSGCTAYALEQNVNGFLKSLPDEMELVDIKYSTELLPGEESVLNSALIIYKPKPTHGNS